MLCSREKKQEKVEELEKVNKTLAAKEEELVDNAIYYAMKTIAKLMKEYKEGKATTWKPDQAIEEFAQAYPEKGKVNSKSQRTSRSTKLVSLLEKVTRRLLWWTR